MYHVANGVALAEYLISLYIKPWKCYPYVSEAGTSSCSITKLLLKYCAGIGLVVFGQLLRTTAMIHASTNFSHMVQYRKANTHELVTTGIYGFVTT